MKSIFFITLFFFAAPAFCETCKYTVIPETQKLQWTAYKTSDKLPVKGEIKVVKVLLKQKTFDSVSGIFQGIQAQADGSSVSSGDNSRDANLKGHFFKNLSGAKKITVVSEKSEGNDENGDLDLSITMNGQKRTEKFKYEMAEGKTLTIKGTIDILNYAGKKAMDALGKVCGDLHKGKDGVSKTWSEVEIQAAVDLKKECT